MKLNFTDFGRRCQFPIVMAAGSLPFPLMICANVMPDSIGACLLAAAVYIALAWSCTVICGRLRVAAGVLASAAMFALSIAMLPVGEVTAAWLIPAMYAFLLLGGLRIGGWERGRELHPMVSALCLIAHIIAQFMVNVDKMNRAEPLYAPVTGLLTGSFLCFAALSVLAMNRSNLVSAVNGQQGVSAAMRWKNRMLSAGLMALTLLVAALPAVIRAIETAWSWLMAAIVALVKMILRFFAGQETSGAPGGNGGMEFMASEPYEPNLFAQIMEKVLIGFSLAAAAVLVFFALRVVWKKLKVLLKILWARLNAYMASSSEDYVDEITDTREEGSTERALRRIRRRVQRRRVDERTLSPRERIRYRYLLLWDRHPEWTPERTARENLSGDAARLYERARYSHHEITEREAEDFAQKYDSKKG